MPADKAQEKQQIDTVLPMYTSNISNLRTSKFGLECVSKLRYV